MKSFGVSEDVLKAKSNELSAPFKKHKITLYTIYAMWYLSMVEWGHFGEDRTMNYKREKDHFVLCWVVVYQSLWCLIGSIPGFDKDELATTKETVLGHLDGVKANVEALQAELYPAFFEENDDEEVGDGKSSVGDT